MTFPVLDDCDRRIINALQVKGDLTQEELADHVHISRSQCSRRVARLRDEGVIDRVVAVVNPEAVGLSIKAYVTILLRSHTDENTNAFEAFVKSTPQITECSMLTGEADYLLCVRTTDIVTFHKFIREALKNAAISTVRSLIVIQEVKQSGALPLGAECGFGRG